MTEFDVAWRDAIGDGAPIPFGKTFVNSDAFKALFKEGMALVEDTAAYLDGPGREDSRRLSRQAALAYASESMRLTTRLMQIASWLLVQRAVCDGEITAGQALQEKTRVRLTTPEPAGNPLFDVEALPEHLRALIALSLRLHARILHLDQLILDETAEPAAAPASPVAAQQGLLRSAFGGR